jgi:hypothetical protein
MNLADFDPDIVAAYHITERDLENVVRYITILQGQESRVLNDLAAGGYYGTSVLLHEVVELRILLSRDPGLLRRGYDDIDAFLQANGDAHVQALAVEYDYLRRKIALVFNEIVGYGELVCANASTNDFRMLFESDVEVPIFEPSAAQIMRAVRLLAGLKALRKEMPK